jgi:hypothetical protein
MPLKVFLRCALKLSSASSLTVLATVAALLALLGATIARSGTASRSCDSKVSLGRRELARAPRGKRRCDC